MTDIRRFGFDACIHHSALCNGMLCLIGPVARPGQSVNRGAGFLLN
ncbi:hypothetical protein ACUSIJ_14715 [Pseudochelatococcus sp. B33]